MTLSIDTTEYGKLVLELSGGKRKLSQTFLVQPRQSDEILTNVDKFLRAQKIKNPQKKISKIVVLKGGGSFTGLRIAAAVAQALGLVWGVKVTARKK